MQPIETIKGKFSVMTGLLSEHYSSSRLQGRLNLGAHNNKGVTYNTIKPIGVRDLVNKPLSTAEIAARDKFAAVRAAVETRKNNPTKRVQDQNAFKAQSTYKTFNAYIWAVCAAEYDEAHSEE